MIVDEHECTYPSIYPKLDLKPPDPILPSSKSGGTSSSSSSNDKGGTAVRYKVNKNDEKGGAPKTSMKL